LQESEPATTLDALETAGEQDVRRLKRFMSDALQRTIPGDIDTLASAAVAPERADHLAQALQDWSACAPLPLLALRMLIDDNPDGSARAWQCWRSVPTWRRRCCRSCARTCGSGWRAPPRSPLPAPTAPVRRRRSQAR
jgi:hypothetical protein